MFAVLEAFFFPEFLMARFDTDEQRPGYVLEQITGGAANQDERRTSYGRD